MASQTAQQILTRALRRLKILAAEEVMDAAQLADGLVTMNGAMHGFGPDGIYYVHADLAATDTVNMPDELIDSLVWMIAYALAPEYGYAFSEGESVALINAKNKLQAAYWVQPPADTDPLLRPYPWRYSSNISRID
jgi:hypothetical protein